MGLRAAAEGPAGSQIPAVLAEAIDDILTDDGEDWLVEHQHRWLPALTRQLERSEAATPSLQAVGTLAYAVAFKSGDFDRALRLYRMLEPDPAREGLGRGLGRTNDFGVDQRWDAGLAAIQLNPEAAAATLAARAQPAEAATILRAAARGAEDPLVRRALNDLALAAQRQAAYNRGEPVELLSHGVAGWRVSRGHAEPVPGAGVRAHYGEGSGSRLVSPPKVGEHYEVALELSPPALWGGRELFVIAGVQLGVDEKINTLNQTGVYFERKGLLEIRSLSADGRHRWTTADELTHHQTTGRETARIYVRRFGNTADLYHNGVPVQRGWEVREQVRGGPLGLGMYWNRRGKVGVHDPIHYRSLWVRKLTGAERRKRAEDDPSSIFHQHRAYAAVVDAPDTEPRWTPPAAPTALPHDPTPVAAPPFAQQEVAALYADVWKHSLNQTAHARADWAPAARALIDRDAIRMAASVDAFRLRPEGHVHRDQDRPEAQRLLSTGAREDLLIRALCRAVLKPNPINRSAAYNEPSSEQLIAAGHAELADVLRRKRAWLHEPDYRPWAWVERGENASMWPDRAKAATALARQADWLAQHPQHAAPLARLIQPRPLEQQERHANHWRRVSGPAVASGGAAEWVARSLRLAYDTAAARTIIDGWYDSDPAHRHDNTLRLALDLLARGEAEALAAWPLATQPAMKAQLAGAIAEAAMDSARAVTGLGRPQDAHRLAQNAADWFHTAAAATPLDTRVFDQWRFTLSRLQEAGGVLASEALPPHRDLEAWSATYRHAWEAHLSLSQMPAARRIGAAQASLPWQHFWPSTPDDVALRTHLIQASRGWLRENGDAALDATLAYARRAQRYPYFGDPSEYRYGHAVSLARWLDRPERASQILGEAGGPEAVGDVGGLGLTPEPAPRALQAAYDAGETIDLMDLTADVWQPLRGRFEETKHQGRRVFTVPAGYARDHWLYCPLEIGAAYRIAYTVVDPGGWWHTSRATSSVGIAFNTGSKSVIPSFGVLPYLGVANNHSVATNSLFDDTPGQYRWATGHALKQLEKAKLKGPNYRVVIENRQGMLSLRVNNILAWEAQPLPGGEPGGGFALGFTRHYSITVPAVRMIDVTVEKLLPAADPKRSPDVPKSKGKRAPRAPR